MNTSKRMSFLVVWSLALSLVAALPAIADEAAKMDFPRPDIVEWTLPNGMDVAYVGVHKTPIVSVQVWYHVGAKDEPRERRGSAHMFEHIMFKGTKHVPPEEHARLIQRIGGVLNAATSEDYTFYYEVVPRQYMGFAMQLEAERMQHLLFRKEMIDTEREVVKEEIRTRKENNPIFKALARARELAFTTHPYNWMATGYKADLDNTTPDDLKKFYDTYYQPNNATLVVVGDVKVDEVKQAASKWFGSIAKAAEPPRPAKAYPEPEQKELRKEEVEAAQVGAIIGGYKMPPASHPDMIPLQVLSTLLSDGESSRLHQRIVRKDRIGVAAGVFLWELEDPGLALVFGIYLSPDQGEKVEAAVKDEVAKLHKTKVGERELQKAKNQLAAKFVYALQEVSGLANIIGQTKIQRGDAKVWMDDYDKLLAVTADDVQRVAKTYFTPERLTLVVVPPGGGASAGKEGAK